MEGIKLPMKQGSMDDISGEGDASSAVEGSQETPQDSMSTQGAKAIYEREAQILIDYALLDDDFKEVCECLLSKSVLSIVSWFLGILCLVVRGCARY